MFRSFNARAVGLDLSVEETIDRAAEARFEGVDLLVRDLVTQGADPRAVRRRLDDRGLIGGAWPLPVHWRGDPETFRRDLLALPRIAEAAATLGLTRTGTWVLPETPDRPEAEPARRAHLEATAAWHVERLGAIARVLDAHGIRLGLEVIGVASAQSGRGWPFVGRLGDLERTLGAVWSEAPNLGILLDGFHLDAAGEDAEAGLAWGVGRVVWVHVADVPVRAQADPTRIRDDDRALPGENPGAVTRSLLARLGREGYDGPVTAEPMAGCRALAGQSVDRVVHRVAEALSEVWPRGATPPPRT